MVEISTSFVTLTQEKGSQLFILGEFLHHFFCKQAVLQTVCLEISISLLKPKTL